MWNLRNKKNKLIKNRLTNIVDNLVMDRGRCFGGLGEWAKGLNKLVADGWSWGWGAWHRECS